MSFELANHAAILAGLGQNVNTSGDIANAAFGTRDFSFNLRAEPSGGRGNRIYTVTYQATDDSGNQETASDYVVVPHDASSARCRQQHFN